MTTSTSPDKVTRYVESLKRSEPWDKPSRDATLVELGDTAFSPASGPATLSDSSTTFGLIELLLKNQPRLDAVARSPLVQRELIPRLLSIGLVGYAIFAAVLAVVYSCAGVWPELTPVAVWLETPNQPLLRFVHAADSPIWSRLLDGSAFHLIGAFSFGLIGAIGVCLPSFYFYSLLAGVRTTMLQVATNALKGLASGAIALLGALPIYLAIVLGLIVLDAPASAVDLVCLGGLVLPFIAGLYGTRSLYIGFLGLADTLPEDRRCRRKCFLRRLLVAWSACYTAVTPVMIYALWDYMGR